MKLTRVRHFILRDYRSKQRLMHGNKLYVAETDVPDRSGYLWECEVEW
ncbi:MAG: hypothetical protein PHR35_07210 [Kiritimatiellae bacterium]|nr:hypothetical protein [Kiritimatiellia bacterium]